MNLLERMQKMINSRKEKNEERIYILDTCALCSSEAMQLIEEASKVIILTGTIQELDKHKYNKDISDNIRIIVKKSREDENSEKYICVSGYEKYEYQDDNIIDYCRKHKKVTILTCDNNLCNKAKAYGISYIFPKRDDEKVKVDNSQKVEVDNQKKQKIKKPYSIIKGVSFKDGNLYYSSDSKQCFILRNEEILQRDNDVKLEIGDIIIRIKNEKNQVVIRKYKICEIKESDYAYFTNSVKLKSSITQKLDNADLPQEVKEKVLELLRNKEENQNIKEKPLNLLNCGEEQPKSVKKKSKGQEQEIIFQKKWIRVQNSNNFVNYINVERQGKLIKTQDYAKGDLLYVSKYNKKQNSLEIHVYKIEMKDNQYVAEKLDEYKLWLVNEIYSLRLSEELQDEICSFFVNHARY